MKACRAKVKRQKIEKAQAQINPKIILIEDDFYPDPLQVKHPIVDWEVHTEDDLKSRSWKITRVGGETSSFISFAELVKACDRDDMDTLWKMVQDRHKLGQLVDVKAKDLWVYLKRLYEPEFDEKYWKFEAHDRCLTWTYYDTCEVHRVTTNNGVDAFMFTEREYPLKDGTYEIMLSSGVRAYSPSEKLNELVQRIQIQKDRAVLALKSGGDRVKQRKRVQEGQSESGKEVGGKPYVPNNELPISEPAPLNSKHQIISYTFRVRDGSEGYWEFIRSNNHLEGYPTIFKMLKSMDRDDLVAVWRLYKEKFESTPPENVFEQVMYNDLKVMFDPDVVDRKWIEMKGKKVNKWILYHSCGVHELGVGGVSIFLLTDKDYPVFRNHADILTQMVKPGFLKSQRNSSSDNQAHELLQKYKKILDSMKEKCLEASS